MGYAVVAVVAPVATTERAPLFGAHGGLDGALAGSSVFNLAAALNLGELAEHTGWALRVGARTAGPGGLGRRGGRRGGWRRRGGGLAGTTPCGRDTVGVSNADVDVGAAVAAADRARVFGAVLRPREASTFGAQLPASSVRPVVANLPQLASLCSGALGTGAIGVSRGFAVSRTARKDPCQEQDQT